MEYQYTDGRYSWDMDLLQWSINEFVYDFRSPATLLGQTQDSVTQRWAWKVHYNSWYDFYSYQDRQELPEKKCGFAAIPTARTKGSTVASRREVFLAFSFRLKSGSKENLIFCWSFLIDISILYLFERKRPSEFRALKGVTYQTWKDLSGGWNLPIPISSQDMGMGRMGGPIGIDPSQEMKKNTVFAGPQTKWDTDFQPAPGQDEWRQLCFAAGIWRKEKIESICWHCAKDGFCFGWNLHPGDWEANNANNCWCKRRKRRKRTQPAPKVNIARWWCKFHIFSALLHSQLMNKFGDELNFFVARFAEEWSHQTISHLGFPKTWGWPEKLVRPWLSNLASPGRCIERIQAFGEEMVKKRDTKLDQILHLGWGHFFFNFLGNFAKWSSFLFGIFGIIEPKVMLEYGRRLQDHNHTDLQDSFLWDDGWDDPHSLWEFDHERFPARFDEARGAPQSCLACETPSSSRRCDMKLGTFQWDTW